MLRRWGELAPKGRIVLTASGRLAMNGPTTNEAPMSLPRTVSSVLNNHVTLEVESIDRMYLNVYVPTLQVEGQVAAFWRFESVRGVFCGGEGSIPVPLPPPGLCLSGPDR